YPLLMKDRTSTDIIALNHEVTYIHQPPCVLFSFFCLTSYIFYRPGDHRDLHSFPTRRSSDRPAHHGAQRGPPRTRHLVAPGAGRSEEHTSELQSRENLVCRLLLEKKKHMVESVA